MQAIRHPRPVSDGAIRPPISWAGRPGNDQHEGVYARQVIFVPLRRCSPLLAD
jgi:hypothetical protein